MLLQVEKILGECYKLGTLPQILLLENVPPLLSESPSYEDGSSNNDKFEEWCAFLKSIGYSNSFKILNCKEVGYPKPLPQNRNRVFMVSMLNTEENTWRYNFPRPSDLDMQLYDLLQDQENTSKHYDVDERYYISDAMIEYCTGVNQKDSDFPRGERFVSALEMTNSGIASCINTREGGRPVDNFIADEETIEDVKKIVRGEIPFKHLEETLEQNDDIDEGDFIDAYNRNIMHGVCKSIDTGISFRNESFVAVAVENEVGGVNLLIPNANSKGYDEASVGDSVNLAYPKSTTRRGRVGHGVSQTILTNSQIGVVVEDDVKVIGNYGESEHSATRIYDVGGVAPTIRGNYGLSAAVAIPNEDKQGRKRLRIRKLTERECARLQGWTDEQHDLIAEPIESTWQYHVYGDSIPVSLLRAIFKRMIK